MRALYRRFREAMTASATTSPTPIGGAPSQSDGAARMSTAARPGRAASVPASCGCRRACRRPRRRRRPRPSAHRRLQRRHRRRSTGRRPRAARHPDADSRRVVDDAVAVVVAPVAHLDVHRRGLDDFHVIEPGCTKIPSLSGRSASSPSQARRRVRQRANPAATIRALIDDAVASSSSLPPEISGETGSPRRRRRSRRRGASQVRGAGMPDPRL